VGARVRVKVVKNKVAPPFKQAEFDLLYGEGISLLGSLLDVATDLRVVTKSGAWYSYGQERLGQGRENAREFLKEHPELVDKISQQVKEILGTPGLKLETAVTGDEKEGE